MLGWVHLSRNAVARAERALVDGEHGVRDELGLLAVHQGLADRLFPGTSVLHTRLRYVLFVPWLMQRAANGRQGEALRRLAEAERRLAGQLLEGRRQQLDCDGIIGGLVYPKGAAQPPSFSYWTALGTWNLLRPQPEGATRSRAEVLAALARSVRARNWTDDDGLQLSFGSDLPFVGSLPDAPSVVGSDKQPLSFTLQPHERRFLKRQLIAVRRPGSASQSLLSRLIEQGARGASEVPWVKPVLAAADPEDRDALAIARDVAALGAVCRAAYAFLVERLRNKDGCCAPTGDRLPDLEQCLGLHRTAAASSDIQALRHLLPDLPQRITSALAETQRWLRAGARPQSVEDLTAVYAAAEARKGSRARISVPDTLGAQRRRAEWLPLRHPAARPIQFRWPNVRRLLADMAS